MNRGQIIGWLTTNCDCWKGQGDRELLGNLSDDKLAKLYRQAEEYLRMVPIANAAVKGIHDAKRGIAYRINQRTGRWEGAVTNACPPASNGPAVYSEEEPPPEVAPSPQVPEDGRNLTKPPPAEGTGAFGGGGGPSEQEQRRNQGGYGAGEEEPANGNGGMGMSDEERDRMNQRRMTGNQQRQRPRNREQIIAGLPPDMQEAFAVAQEVTNAEKAKLVSQLTANIADPQRKQYHQQRLMQRSVKELRDEVDLMPPAPPPPDVQRSNRAAVANRGGGAGQYAGYSGADDRLDLPTTNWQVVDGKATDVGGATAGGGSGQGATPLVGNMDDVPFEELVNQLPAYARNLLQNAAVIEQRERSQLIDAITANLDEEAEVRMRGVLANKPLEELRALQMLAPQPQRRPTANWFGAAGTAPAANAASNPQEDVLDLPRLTFGAGTNGN